MNNSTACRLDHLVVTAGSCDQGVAWFQALSGIQMPVGGEHPLMGTHNHLTALAADQFLEIIAINPSAVEPVHPRWFRLSEAGHLKKISVKPQLTTWVAATDNLQSCLQLLSASGIDAGKPVHLTRGDLRWKLALRDNGSLAFDGIFPILIEWPESVNPVATMKDQSVRLGKFSATHPDYAAINSALATLGLSSVLTVTDGSAELKAECRVGQRLFNL